MKKITISFSFFFCVIFFFLMMLFGFETEIKKKERKKEIWIETYSIISTTITEEKTTTKRMV